MIKQALRLIGALLLVLTLAPAHAQEQSPGPVLRELVEAGNHQQALELGTANLAEWEGDTDFDFYYGLAALEAGSPNEAVFALERVVATADPGVLRERARLELARAYFLTNNLTAAESLFNAVLATNPPSNVQQNVQAFLVLIDARRNTQQPSINWSISSIVGSDDNINSATSNSFIDTPLIGEIELNPDGRETEDEFMNTSASMVYNYPLSRDRSVSATVNLTHLNNFDTDQFDIDSLRGEVAYNWGSGNNRFRHGVTGGKINLDQNGFQDAVGINSSWQHSGSNGWYQSLGAAYTQIRYDTSNGGDLNDLRDVDQLLVTGGLTKIAGQLTHSLNLYHADEDPEDSRGRHNGRQFTGLAYNLLYRLNASHTPYLRASLQDVEHDSRHPVFFETTREDDRETVAVGWFWQLDRNLVISAEASYTDNGSNIELFDYTRFKYQAGFRYQF